MPKPNRHSTDEFQLNEGQALTLLTSFIALAACSKVNMGATAGEGETTISDSGSSSSTNGIIGGTEVAASDEIAKTTVQILALQPVRTPDGKTGMSIAGCTGSILADDIILTAAHCTIKDPRYILLYFSSKTVDVDKLLSSSTMDPLLRRVVGGKTGSNWPKLKGNQESDWGDIALLKFAGGLPSGFHPVQLLPTDYQLQAKESITLAGFGITDGTKGEDADPASITPPGILKVDVSILDPDWSASEMMIDSSHGHGPCHGDSGGPAYVKINGENFVAGTTSRADFETDPKGQCTGNTVYTKVQPYLAWIQSTMKTLEDPNFQGGTIPQPRAMKQQDQKPSPKNQ